MCFVVVLLKRCSEEAEDKGTRRVTNLSIFFLTPGTPAPSLCCIYFLGLSRILLFYRSLFSCIFSYCVFSSTLRCQSFVLQCPSFSHFIASTTLAHRTKAASHLFLALHFGSVFAIGTHLLLFSSHVTPTPPSPRTR